MADAIRNSGFDVGLLTPEEVAKLCIAADPASLPNDEAKVRETPEDFVSEQPCLCLICGEPGVGTPNHKPWCKSTRKAEQSVIALGKSPTNPASCPKCDGWCFTCTRADPALAYGETSSAVHNDASGQQTVHNAQQGVREGVDYVEESRQRGWEQFSIARDQLAAKNAEIKARDTLIRQLTDALRETTEYVEFTHASIKGAVGHDNVVLPVLKRCQEAIAAAERHEKGEW